MVTKILITGGAGFIGSHLARELVANGHQVRLLDPLLPQVHGQDALPPSHLPEEVEFVRGDVRDPAAVDRALDGVDAVYHFAAAVGVGQSMYEMRHYAEVNTVGTTVLLERIAAAPVKRLVVASSMSIYGEGLYADADGQVVEDVHRDGRRLQSGEWEPVDSEGRALRPLPTPEHKRPSLSSVYALTKYDQERLCLIAGAAYDIPTTALRFFNVYGPHQALGNPYTGVLAIFASRILNGKQPLVYEDGHQRRDFVSVYDVARACALALDCEAAAGEVINVGSGESRSVLEVADTMLRLLGREDLSPRIAKKYRVGDIRHCFADITKAREVLGYRPRVPFDKGVAELAQWLEGQAAADRFDDANAELERRGLVV